MEKENEEKEKIYNEEKKNRLKKMKN